MFILACLFALPAAAQTTTIWSATLTVDVREVVAGINLSIIFKGCSSTGSTVADDCSVTLSDNEFTHGGTTYTVERLLWNNDTNEILIQFSGITGSVAKTGLSAATLNAHSSVLPIASGTSESGLIKWDLSDPGWTDGQQISVSLTIPRAPDPDPASVQSAYVDGRTLTVTFNKALRESSVPAPAAFEVRAGGERHDVDTVGIERAVLTLTLVQPVDLARAVTLTYRFQTASRPLTDVDGIRVAYFFGLPVQPTTPTPAMPFVAVVVLALLLARRGRRRLAP